MLLLPTIRMKENEFIATVMPYKDRLYRIAKRILVSADEAEDAVQEVFLKLWNFKLNRKFGVFTSGEHTDFSTPI